MASTITTQCESCLLAARECALENYLDEHGLRWPDMERPGSFRYDELTPEQYAEVEQWAQMLMTWAPTDLGWHELHQEYAR